MRRILFLFLLLPNLALAAGSNLFSSAQDKVQLIQQGPAVNGQVALALNFALAPGWHIYGADPGSVGYPPGITAAPPVTFSPLTFPPTTVLHLGPLTENVLSGNVTLPFTASHTGPTLTATASWLVCADTCIPEHAVFTLPLAATLAAAAPATPAAIAPAAATYLPYLALAFLGGLLLNFMPCVFPILAMKALAVARLGGAETKIRHEAFGYTFGVMVSMLALGLLLLALRALGAAAGWGFQFQSPIFVALLAWLMLTLTLNLAGMFEFLAPTALNRIPAQHSILTGALAVLTATPCTAPFMGSALAAALTAPALLALGIFLALGLGLALPFLFLALIPRTVALLPRPGVWMLYLQRVLAVPMAATFLWLAWVLYRQTGPQGLLLLLLGSALLALALGRKKLRPLALALLLILPFLHTATNAAALTLPGAQPFTPERLTALRRQNTPVFVDLTAAWCVTCLVNEATTLATPPVQADFASHHVTLLVGDWTDKNPAITALLTANHRSGVPLYLYYKPGSTAPVILPQILSAATVKAALNQDSPTTAPSPAPGG
jgi:thiol:disulfide interchange protein DsbD